MVTTRRAISSPTKPWGEPDQKIAWLKLTIAAAFICGFGLSWRLWTSSRLFPLSPVSSALPAIPFPFDYILFFLLLGLLLAIIIIARPQRLILVFLALAGLLSLLDQARWQPWFFEYFFRMAAIGLYAWTEPAAQNRQAALNASRVILIFTYFWSGLQKLNANFITQTWPDVAGPFLQFLPKGMREVPAVLVLLVPALEISIGLGLITRKYRNVSVVLAVATHVFILMLLIFSGENTVVWPWNVAMILLVVVLFWQDRETVSVRILVPKTIFHALVLLLFAVLPVFSLADLWDSYLSSALYSGNTDQAVILVSPAVVNRLPAPIRPHIWQKSRPLFLDVNRWSYAELNVPLYPEPRIYRRVARQICAYGESSPDIKLVIREKPDPFTGHRQSEYYDCAHL